MSDRVFEVLRGLDVGQTIESDPRIWLTSEVLPKAACAHRLTVADFDYIPLSSALQAMVKADGTSPYAPVFEDDTEDRYGSSPPEATIEDYEELLSEPSRLTVDPLRTELLLGEQLQGLLHQLTPGALIRERKTWERVSYTSWQGASTFELLPEATLSLEALRAAKRCAGERRVERVRDKLASLVARETALLAKLEHIDLRKLYNFLEGGKLSATNGRLYFESPQRVVETEQFGALVVSVRGARRWFKERDDYGSTRFFVKAYAGSEHLSGAYWVAHLYPCEEVDEQGLPLIRDRERLEMGLVIERPYRQIPSELTHTGCLVDLGNKSYVGQQDDPYGGQGYAPMVFDHFYPDASDTPYHEPMEGSAPTSAANIPRSLYIPADMLANNLAGLFLRMPELGLDYRAPTKSTC